jgi:hypothetical protein
LKQSNNKRAGLLASKKAGDAAIKPFASQSPAVPQRSKESRNKANTIRNAAKVEHYLMEVEKAHGFAKSWALRERLEQGQVSLDELIRR